MPSPAVRRGKAPIPRSMLLNISGRKNQLDLTTFLRQGKMEIPFLGTGGSIAMPTAQDAARCTGGATVSRILSRNGYVKSKTRGRIQQAAALPPNETACNLFYQKICGTHFNPTMKGYFYER